MAKAIKCDVCAKYSSLEEGKRYGKLLLVDNEAQDNGFLPMKEFEIDMCSDCVKSLKNFLSIKEKEK